MLRDKELTLSIFIGSVRLLATSVVLLLVVFIGVGAYAFYGLVIHPKIERVNIELEAERIERINAASRASEGVSNDAFSQE